MKKFYLIPALIIGLAVTANAWEINEFSQYDSDYGITDVWFQVNNNTLQSITGLGVGIGENLNWNDGIEDNDRVAEGGAPHEMYNGGSSVGNWYGYVLAEDDWETYTFHSSTTVYNEYMSFSEYFGVTWEDVFAGYEYAYVSVPNFYWGASNPGSIPAGFMYTDVDDEFWYFYGDEGVAWSSTFIQVENGDISFGETDVDNANVFTTPAAVPIPSTMFLLGIGFASLAALKRKK